MYVTKDLQIAWYAIFKIRCAGKMAEKSQNTIWLFFHHDTLNNITIFSKEKKSVEISLSSLIRLYESLA